MGVGFQGTAKPFGSRLAPVCLSPCCRVCMSLGHYPRDTLPVRAEQEHRVRAGRLTVGCFKLFGQRMGVDLFGNAFDLAFGFEALVKAG